MKDLFATVHQQTAAANIEENMSNLTSASGDQASVSSSTRNDYNGGLFPPHLFPPSNQPQPNPAKKKRNQPGHPDPDSEVIALSPRSLLATNRFVCEICNKGFQRDQNLQLHRRGHNLPWKLKQRTNKEMIRKKVYVCPETSCVHHDPTRALGDLTGIKKHFCRKHGEKKWKCDKCSKRYAVQSDWKAHSKICGTREYRCDCGTIFSRRDSYITHRSFCAALAEESARSITRNNSIPLQATATSSSAISHYINLQQLQSQLNNPNELPFPIKKEQQNFITRPEIPPWLAGQQILGPGSGPPHIDLTAMFQDFQQYQDFSQNYDHDHQIPNPIPSASMGPTTLSPYHLPPAHVSATALLQKAAQMDAKSSSSSRRQTPSPAGDFIRPHHTHVSANIDSCLSTTAGFGLNLSSRDELINGLASYGNKAATMTRGCTETGALLHEMMMNNPQHLSSSTGFEGRSAFQDIAFGAVLNHGSKKDDGSFHAAHGQFTSSSTKIAGNDESMTRDFLGLRPLSQSDILSMAGLGNSMNSSSSCNDNQNQAHISWQG